MTLAELFEIRIVHGYILQIFLAELLFFPLLERRSRFAVRLAVSFVLFALLSIIITNLVYRRFPSGFNSVIIFLLSLGLGAACFKSFFKEVAVLLCGRAAAAESCAQH